MSFANGKEAKRWRERKEGRGRVVNRMRACYVQILAASSKEFPCEVIQPLLLTAPGDA